MMAILSYNHQLPKFIPRQYFILYGIRIFPDNHVAWKLHLLLQLAVQ